MTLKMLLQILEIYKNDVLQGANVKICINGTIPSGAQQPVAGQGLKNSAHGQVEVIYSLAMMIIIMIVTVMLIVFMTILIIFMTMIKILSYLHVFIDCGLGNPSARPSPVL